MPNQSYFYELILIEKLKKGDKSAFTTIFSSYYNDLVQFAFQKIHDAGVSEEIVQEVFLNIWESRNKIEIHTSLKAYLLRSVQYKCIDRMRHMMIRQQFAESFLENPVNYASDADSFVLYSELKENLEKALGKLSSEYAEVFRMSRFDFMTYPEIAEKLNLSVRAIEVRMGKALSILRHELRDYLPGK